MSLAIEARDLTRRFGTFTAVDAISVGVREGEVFGFLGANGAGKTTAIKMLIGLLAPTAGSARVAGFDILTQSEEVRRRYLPESTLHGAANLLLLPNIDAANILFNVLKQTAGHGVTIGPILLSALRSQDIYLSGFILLFVSALTLVGMLISDLLLAVADPRIRLSGKAGGAR